MKKFLILLVFMCLISCREEAQSTTKNGNFNVEFLFENDGCKVYRFNDGGRCIYYSDCRGKIESSYTTRTGKSTITHHDETLNN